MRLNLISKILITVIFFIVLVIIFPQNIEFSETSNLLTASTVLFGLLAGFFIASALTNYFRLQSLIAEETAGLISVYHTCCQIAPEMKNKIKTVIDNYVIAAFDYELIEYINKTWPQFNKIFGLCGQIKFKDNNAYAAMLTENYSSLLAGQDNLLRIRQEITLTARTILGWGHWLFLICLAVIVIFLLYVIKDNSLVSSIITVLLSTATVLILILLNDIDSDLFAEDQLSFVIFQQIFFQMNLLPYYPEDVLQQKRIKLKPGQYRIGYYKNWPQTTDKKIKIITLK